MVELGGHLYAQKVVYMLKGVDRRLVSVLPKLNA